jgi:hypothetical protein
MDRMTKNSSYSHWNNVYYTSLRLSQCQQYNISPSGFVPLRLGVLDTTLCDKVCQWLVTGRWCSLCTPVSSTNKTDCHDIAEILLKVALNTITNQLNHPFPLDFRVIWNTRQITCVYNYLKIKFKLTVY